METDKTIKLRSNDNIIIELTRKAASKSGLLKGIIEDFPDDSEFPLNDVDGKTLEKIKLYLIHYQDKEPAPIKIPLPSENYKECVDLWDYNFVNEEFSIIISLILAANYMDIKPLLELCSSKIGIMIKGITTESIKKEFDITEPLTKEEEEQFLSEKSYLEANL